MSRHRHHPNPNFPCTLRAVYQRFQERARDTEPDRELLLEQDGTSFLGAWVGLRDNLDMKTCRRSVGDMLCLEKFRMIQVVGDSGSGFADDGRQLAHATISGLITDYDDIKYGPSVLEYGYTASNYDTNWIVNDIIAQMPQIGSRTVASVVHASATAVESWGCEAISEVTNMVLAYHDKEETAFGSDMWLSDLIMDAVNGDELICLEGGPQAFAQAVNVLLKSVPVTAITGSKMRAEIEPQRFSAAYLLSIMYHWFRECAGKGNVSSIETEKLKIEAMRYLDSHELLRALSRRSQYVLVQTSLTRLMESPEKLDIVRVVYAD